MPVKAQHDTHYSLWFITFTCFKWKHLFELTKSYDLVYSWFNYLTSTKTADVCAYVIMPNHVHVILHIPVDTKTVNTIVGNGKRFMAYALIERIKAGGFNALLEELTIAATNREKQKGQLHKVFEESFDAKPIFNREFLSQKLDYIHHNPVSKKWSLVKDYADYEHSSASFYEKGIAKNFLPIHCGDVW